MTYKNIFFLEGKGSLPGFHHKRTSFIHLEIVDLE
jgi:hypothetical protein